MEAILAIPRSREETVGLRMWFRVGSQTLSAGGITASILNLKTSRLRVKIWTAT